MAQVRAVGTFRKCFLFLSLILSLATTGCAYDGLKSNLALARQRIVTLQRDNQRLESRLLARQGEQRALQERLARMQREHHGVEAELREANRRATEDESLGDIVDAAANLAPEETGFDGIDSVTVERGIAGEVRLTVGQQILFPAGKASITSSGKNTLAEVAAVLKRDYAGGMVRVEGHTDNTPVSRSRQQFPSNWELSSARASAVLRVLLEAKAIDATRCEVVGCGAERPVASNQSPEGRSANRRVEIVIVP